MTHKIFLNDRSFEFVSGKEPTVYSNLYHCNTVALLNFQLECIYQCISWSANILCSVPEVHAQTCHQIQVEKMDCSYLNHFHFSIGDHYSCIRLALCADRQIAKYPKQPTGPCRRIQYLDR